jgi:deoxyribodipyrimidine photolyase-related protein
MKALRLILGDQLSMDISSLEGIDKENDIILMCEVYEETTYTKHHPKKIAFLFSAMRHFAKELGTRGFNIRYIKLDDPDNAGSFDGEVKRALSETLCDTLIVTEPGEWRILKKFKTWRDTMGIDVSIREDTRFLCSIADFSHWAVNRKQLRMEYFYRDMRRKYNILLDGIEPVGGQWNYDSENRKPGKTGMSSPKRLSHKKDSITLEVLDLVQSRFSDHFGDLEPFHFAVTRDQALKELHHFIEHLMQFFGEFQDAMVAGEAYLYHSLLSAYINAGLLNPLEVCRLAEQAYNDGKVPLNAAEGFIRQIIGWREYVRGIYWYHMPQYAELNHLNADQTLPGFYWGTNTKMFCVSEAVRHTKEHAYSHHIQRLMITGNFALIAGIDPKEICDWYLAVYADAYEWVELPNTLGMALFGDGGIMASKPYAASGKYINRMSDYCKNCFYDPNQMIGERACPFNALYWDFLARNDQKLRDNHRMSFMYATLDRMGDKKRQDIFAQAKMTLKAMSDGSL